MGRDVIQFNVSLIVWDKVSRPASVLIDATALEEKWPEEPKRLIEPTSSTPV